MSYSHAILVAGLSLCFSLAAASQVPQPSKIDRHALVTRHNYTLTAFDGERPVQVGNGEFAFGMDITGLQTFAPFNTMAHWGWNSLPLPAGVKLSDYQEVVVDTHGRPVPYPLADPKHPELSTWLAGNPHAINLGRIGFELTKSDGSRGSLADIQNPSQKVDLWTGLVTSQFEFEGKQVVVVTACHPKSDTVAVRVESPLIRTGQISVFLSCPEDNGNQFDNFVGDSNRLVKLDLLKSTSPNRADLLRRLGPDSYYVRLQWDGKATLQPPETKAPHFVLLEAEYGAADKWLDVTAKLQEKVKDGKLVVHVDNTLGADPIHGTVKRLKVTYSLAGRHETAEAGENEDLVIDPVAAARRFILKPTATSNQLSFQCTFTKPTDPNAAIKQSSNQAILAAVSGTPPNVQATIDASRTHWEKFWQTGGAIDLSGSTDPRWMELERRLVLSQYLLAVNEAGAYPPQESGLVNNGWFGRFHMEMYWWHAAHWALWNRWNELDRSLGIYNQLLAGAKKRAKEEGYKGARWPKCIGPNGREWPFTIHSWLVWQQPHPIFFADLDYRAHPTLATLKKWQPVVEATADFLASYAFFDVNTQRYILGPPLFVVSENTDPLTTQNPTFELGYWRFGLRVAQEWRQAMGLPPKKEWAEVLAGLSPLPVEDGRYVLHEGVKDMWTKWNFEHPALTGVLGILPGDGVERPTMQRTLDQVEAKWNFDRTWGWDYPMLAMCAAKLGQPAKAIDFLLTSSPGFQYDVHGLATGGPFPYFPSNGGLLYAAALMAAGWDHAPSAHAPGFPSDGKWNVKYEGLAIAP